jgi:hypothetical protein
MTVAAEALSFGQKHTLWATPAAVRYDRFGSWLCENEK